MTQGKQFGLSATQKIAMWSRRKAGQSLPEIGRAFGKSHSSIRCVVSHHGGFVPALRQRSLLELTLTEREEISRGIASGSSIPELTKLLERVASTVSRKVARHGGRPEYRAKEADDQAWESALRRALDRRWNRHRAGSLLFSGLVSRRSSQTNRVGHPAGGGAREARASSPNG